MTLAGLANGAALGALLHELERRRRMRRWRRRPRYGLFLERDELGR
jgi:hypothetical protein